jgi:hypothetical protein
MREKLRRLLPIKKMGVMPEKLESLEGFGNVLVGIAEGNGAAMGAGGGVRMC